jgi:hypothetical protein
MSLARLAFPRHVQQPPPLASVSAWRRQVRFRRSVLPGWKLASKPDKKLPLLVVLSGGARAQVRDWLSLELIEMDDLVLEGFAWAAQELPCSRLIGLLLALNLGVMLAGLALQQWSGQAPTAAHCSMQTRFANLICPMQCPGPLG